MRHGLSTNKSAPPPPTGAIPLRVQLASHVRASPTSWTHPDSNRQWPASVGLYAQQPTNQLALPESALYKRDLKSTPQFTSIMAPHSAPIHASRRPFAAGNGYLAPANKAHRLDSLLLHIWSAEVLLTGLTSSVLIFLGSPRWVRFKFLVIKTPLRWDLPVATGCYLHTSGTMGAAVKSAVKGRKSSSSRELGQEPRWEASAEVPVRQNITRCIYNSNVQTPYFIFIFFSLQWSVLAGWSDSRSGRDWNVCERLEVESFWKATGFFIIININLFFFSTNRPTCSLWKDRESLLGGFGIRCSVIWFFSVTSVIMLLTGARGWHRLDVRFTQGKKKIMLLLCSVSLSLYCAFFPLPHCM